MIIMGVDSGKNGGIAVINSDFECILCEPMPLAGKIVDGAAIAKIWKERFGDFVGPTMTYIEKVGSMPKQGVSSTFAFGYNFGVAVGAIAGNGWPYDFVTPQQWMKVVLKGHKRHNDEDKKDASRQHAVSRYPNIDFFFNKRRKAHDGMSDALCIAEYGLWEMTR